MPRGTLLTTLSAATSLRCALQGGGGWAAGNSHADRPVSAACRSDLPCLTVPATHPPLRSQVEPRQLYTSSPTSDRAARQGLGGVQVRQGARGQGGDAGAGRCLLLRCTWGGRCKAACGAAWAATPANRLLHATPPPPLQGLAVLAAAGALVAVVTLGIAKNPADTLQARRCCRCRCRGCAGWDASKAHASRPPWGIIAARPS